MGLINKKKGFSLVELLIVISIIGILASISTFSFSKSRPKARLAVVQSQLGSLQPYLVMCLNDNTAVDFTITAPLSPSDTGGPSKICSTANANAVFGDLPPNWIYTVSSLVSTYRACTNESDTWEVICSDTGCLTTTPVVCP